MLLKVDVSDDRRRFACCSDSYSNATWGNGNKDEGRLTLKVSERDESGGWQ